MTWQSWSCFWQRKWVSLWVPQALDSAWCDSAWGPDPCVDPCDPSSLSDGDNKSDTLSSQICGFRVSRVWKNSAENGFCLWWFGNPLPWLDFCLCFASWCAAAVVKSLGHLSSQIQRPDGLSWLLFQVTVTFFSYIYLKGPVVSQTEVIFSLFFFFFVFDWCIWLWICCLSLQTENATSFVCFHILLHNSYNFRSLLYHIKNYINAL